LEGKRRGCASRRGRPALRDWQEMTAGDKERKKATKYPRRTGCGRWKTVIRGYLEIGMEELDRSGGVGERVKSAFKTSPRSRNSGKD